MNLLQCTQPIGDGTPYPMSDMCPTAITLQSSSANAIVSHPLLILVAVMALLVVAVIYVSSLKCKLDTVMLIAGPYHGVRMLVEHEENEIVLSGERYHRLIIGAFHTNFFDYSGKPPLTV